MTYKKKILVKIVDESKLTLLAAWCNWERLLLKSVMTRVIIPYWRVISFMTFGNRFHFKSL